MNDPTSDIYKKERPKPLIIGEAPSKNETTEHPIEGRVGKRLATCCGMTLQDFLKHFDRVNLLHVRQDTKEKGFEFDAKAGKAAADELRKSFQPDQVVLFLGGRVSEAFGVHGPYFEQRVVNGINTRAFIVPHPSGVNRWWNDPANLAQMNTFMRSIVGQTK